MKMTIIIPTRSRANTLQHSLLTCTSQNYDNLEIIVSDNASDDDTEEIVRSIQDKRIRYVKTPHRISMRANFEFPLSLVKEGYVGFIGDDDGLLPGAIQKAVSFIRDTDTPALTSVLCFYRWPCAPEAIRNTGSLQTCSFGDTTRNSAQYIKKSLRGHGAYYVHDLPSLYYGFAKYSLAKPRDGSRFFNSLNPDAYSAYAIAAQTPSYGYLGTPLFIVGASGRSNGVSSLQKDADPGEADAFGTENDFPFHPDYINCRSIAVCVHEAYRQVVDRYPRGPTVPKSSMHEMFRYMSREADPSNREAFIAAALEMGRNAHIRESRIRRIFRPSTGFVSRKGRSLRKKLRRAVDRSPLFSGHHSVSSIDYPDMTEFGVYNALDASRFFDKQLVRRAAQHPTSS